MAEDPDDVPDEDFVDPFYDSTLLRDERALADAVADAAAEGAELEAQDAEPSPAAPR